MPIDPRQQPLWERIVAHRFDDPAARLTFTARLARENGWTIGHAVRVVDEYRRFVFLAMTAGHPVTPSEDVDQAWHLHLAYTRDYWDTFCGEVLNAPLHHGPTRGGVAEAGRYDQQYRRTLAAYAAAFDTPPPADIWPPPEKRFGSDLAWRRVNVAGNWVVPKPRWLRGRRRRATSLAGFAAVPVMAAGIPNPLDLAGPPFLTLFATLAAGAIAIGLLLRRVFLPAGDPAVTADSLEPLEIALLANDGRLRCAATGLASLVVVPESPGDDAEKDAPAGFAMVAAPPSGSPPLLAAMHARLAALGACTPGEAVKTAVEVGRDEFEPRLVDRGLIVGSWWGSAVPWIILGPAIATMALGVAKIAVGVSRGKPAGFLVLGCVLLGLFSLLVVARRPRRTRQGDAVLEEARRRFQESGQEDEWLRRRQSEGVDSSLPIVPAAIALLGTATLGGTAYAFLDRSLGRGRQGQPGWDGGMSSSGWGCGTTGDGGGGCSTSSDGGGGGGCGGCGGCGGGGGD